MRLLADSGSTKTDWLVFRQDTPRVRFVTSGLNPTVMGVNSFRNTLRRELPPHITNFNITEAEFFGAGCTAETVAEVKSVLAELLPSATTITVSSDLLGACRAVCNGREGIVAILGTGSNSCLYDGQSTVRHTPPLGFILGDEGSGAALGKIFLRELLRGRLSETVEQAFYSSTSLTEQDIIRRVYHTENPNSFLASFAPFLRSWGAEPTVRRLITDNFRNFFNNSIRPYRRPDLPVECVGSLAYHFSDFLNEAALAEGFMLGHIVKSPLDTFLHR